MADSTSAVASPPVSAGDLERAEKFALEPFLLEGEDASLALAEGTPRRRALDAVLTELDSGRERPSVEWRRQFSLLLGLERLLSEEEPHLADKTTLSAHQVDALSGTLIALLAEAQGAFRNGNGNGRSAQLEELPSGEEEIEGDEDIDSDEEPLDWDLDEEREEERASDQLLDDPNSARRFWFEHATGAGKTVAALGFVEGSRTGGVLILTHRRNLVDQFHGELFDRGYKKRVTPALLGRDQDFDQEELAALLDQGPFNAAVADLYRVRFKDLPGVVYAAGVQHAYNVAKAFQDAGMKAKGVSGETPKRELTRILAAYERGEIDVLVNAQLLAEGWNSPRATVCMHLAPTASKRIYQQRVGRVTRRHPGKEAGIVVDFVHPATKHDDPVVTLHSLLDRDVYRGGAIVVRPVRRGRGRRIRVERRVLPVTPDPDRRASVFERELWRIAVEHLSWQEQHVWAALAGARVASHNWRRAKAMLHFDSTGELRRRFVITCLQRNRNTQLRIRALQEIAAMRDAEAFDEAVDIVGGWSRDERREGVKTLLQALAERSIGRRDQATAWLWRLAEYTRDIHEEYAVQRWPDTDRPPGD